MLGQDGKKVWGQSTALIICTEMFKKVYGHVFVVLGLFLDLSERLTIHNCTSH
jgi:hypothetical protein